MSIDLATTVRRSSEILHTALGDEVVIMDVDAAAYFGLDAVGARIWSMVEQAASLSAVVDQLVAEFDVGREQCETSVRAFAADLVEHGILDVIDG